MSPHQHEHLPDAKMTPQSIKVAADIAKNVKVIPSPIKVAADMARSMEKDRVNPTMPPKPVDTEVKEEDFAKTHAKVKNMIE